MRSCGYKFVDEHLRRPGIGYVRSINLPCLPDASCPRTLDRGAECNLQPVENDTIQMKNYSSDTERMRLALTITFNPSAL